MKTVLTRSIDRAAGFIRRGEVVAFPTETVYGLGAPVFDERAIRKVFRAKGRPADNPLIAHVSDFNQIEVLASRIPVSAARLIQFFFPGPLTLILPRRPEVPDVATGGLDTVGIRMPIDETAHDFIRACGSPLVAPSANRSGRPSPTRWQAVRDDLDGRISCILQRGATRVGLESTVVDCSGRTPVVLRAGAVTLEELRGVEPSIRAAGHAKGDAAARSPGTRYRHYAPKARVMVVDALEDVDRSMKAGFIGMRPPLIAAGFGRVRLCRDLHEYAHALYGFFRECDEHGLRAIYCGRVEERGLGVAIMDRIRRASAR